MLSESDFYAKCVLFVSDWYRFRCGCIKRRSCLSFVCFRGKAPSPGKLIADRSPPRWLFGRCFPLLFCVKTAGSRPDQRPVPAGSGQWFPPVPCHSLARCFTATGRRTDKGLWETEHLRGPSRKYFSSSAGHGIISSACGVFAPPSRFFKFSYRRRRKSKSDEVRVFFA